MEYQSAQIGNLAKSLAAVQMELEPAAKNAKNPHLKNKYADLSSCYDACRKILPQHGLAVSQIIVPTNNNTHVCVRTLLIHESGEWLASDCVLEAKGNNGINPAQACGSAITYARRYGLSAIVGIVADDDDDGNTSGMSGKQQVQETRRQAAEANPDPASKALRKAFMAALTERTRQSGGSEEARAAYLAELSHFFGREIKTSNELTQAEMKEYLNAVNANKNDPDLADVPF